MAVVAGLIEAVVVRPGDERRAAGRDGRLVLRGVLTWVTGEDTDPVDRGLLGDVVAADHVDVRPGGEACRRPSGGVVGRSARHRGRRHAGRPAFGWEARKAEGRRLRARL